MGSCKQSRWLAIAWVILFLPMPVVSQADAPTVDLPDEAVQRTPLPVELGGIDSWLGTETVVSGDFTDPGAWTYKVSEVGGPATAGVESQALRLRVDDAPKRGSLFGFQTVEVDGSDLWGLSYRARELGPDPAFVQVLVRERDAEGKIVDTRLEHTLGASWAEYVWEWTPRMSNPEVTLYMRIFADEGESVDAWFDDVSFRSMPRIEWSGTATILEDHGLRAVVQAPGIGEYTVRAKGYQGEEMLWDVEDAFTATNAPPVACLDMVPEAMLQQRISLDASCSTHLDGPLSLRGREFQGSAWSPAGARETGGRVAWTVENGSLVAELTDANKTGTIYAWQGLSFHDGPARFSVTAQDNGGIEQYRFLVRERNATGANTDSQFVFPSTTEPTRYTWDWSPKRDDTTEVRLYLRFEAGPGQDAEVRFRDPAVLSGLTFSWEVDDEPVPDSGAILERAFRTPGWHKIALTVRDGDGGVDTLVKAVKVVDPGYDFRVEVPEAWPLGPPVPLDAGATQRPGGVEELVRNGRFLEGTAGWAFSTTEVGDGTFEVEDGGAVIRTAAEKRGTIYAFQDVPTTCAEVACRLSFEARTLEGTPHLQGLLRSRIPDAEGGHNQDQKVEAQIGSDWTPVSAVWDAPDDAESLRVYLRYVVEAGEQAAMEFRNISLTPRETYRWTLETPAGPVETEGRHASFRPQATGPVPWTLTVEDPWGNQGSTSGTIEVLPVHAYPSLRGGIGLAWPPEAEVTNVPVGQRGDAMSHAVAAPAMWNVSWQGRTWQLDGHALEAALQQPPVQFSGRADRDAWTDRYAYNATVRDLAVASVEVQLLDGGRVVASKTIEPDDARGSLRLPMAWSAKDYDVRYVLTEHDGTEHEIEAEPFHVDANGQLWLAPVIFLLAALVPAITLLRRKMRG